jgi:hypothetical protein
MKKRIKKEPLLNILAREVGRAAGTIANATQGLSVNAAATDKKREKVTGMSRQRVMPKKKNSGKSADRRSRKRPSHRSE